jgi:hypothetical protein
MRSSSSTANDLTKRWSEPLTGANCVQCVCHGTLPWLISVSLDAVSATKSLDIFDALGVKDVYAPKRQQGERKH